MKGRICFAPSAQFMPTLSSGMCETEIQNASTVWPESVRPLRSTMVTETMTGTRLPEASKYSSMANRRGLGVQRVEDGFEQQQVDAAFDQGAGLLVVGFAQLVEGDAAGGGIADVLRDRGGARWSGPSSRRRSSGGRRCAAVKPSAARRAICAPAKLRSCDAALQAVIGHGDGVGVEGVGLDDVGAGFEVLRWISSMICGCVRFSASMLPRRSLGWLANSLPRKSASIRLARLDHGAHGAIEQQDALAHQLQQLCANLFSVI